MRATAVQQDDLLLDLNELRKENDRLKMSLTDLESRLIPENDTLAGLDGMHEVTLEWTAPGSHAPYKRTEKARVSWGEMFACIAPDLVELPNNNSVTSKLGSALYRKLHPGSDQAVKVQHDDFQTVRTQFLALDLISTTYTETTRGSMALFWSLTKRGERLMIQMRTVKAASNKTDAGDA